MTHPVFLTSLLTLFFGTVFSPGTAGAAPAAVVPADSADLSLTLLASSGVVPLASNLVFTLRVRNDGLATATSVAVTDRLPAGANFVSATASQGECGHDAGVVTCRVGSLERGASAELTVTLRPGVYGVMSNFASVAATQLDPAPENNSAYALASAGLADVVVALGGNPNPVTAGRPLTFTVTASNRGPDAAPAAMLSFEFEEKFCPQSAALSQGELARGLHSFVGALGPLPPGAIATLTVTGVATEEGEMFSAADASGGTSDPNFFNNCTNAMTAVLPGAGLLRFERANFDARENGGAATINVIRTGGTASQLTVDYAAADGTALAGLDYTVVRGTLRFADGVRTQPFVVPLLDDGSAECNETVRLSLFNATGGGGATVLCPGTNATLTIVDGDGAHRGEVLLVSANTNSAPASGDGASGRPLISASGRFVAFHSPADDLAAGNPVVNPDVFVRDLASGTTRRLSVDLALSSAFNPVLSGHGRNVVFNGEFEPGGGALYVHRGEFGTNQAVSVRPDGGLSWASGFGASISSNGLVIAFVSDGDDLAPLPVNNANHDVFVRDLATQTTTLVSINAAGTGEGNDASFGARVSADGRFVVFVSYASDLVTNDTGGGADVFLRDLQAGATTLVSRNRQGTGSGDAESVDAVISADGRYVAFTSYAGDLVAGDANFAQDVFLFDRVAGTTTLISANRFGTGSGNDESSAPSISADGRQVAFESRASDLVPNDVNGQLADVFMRDVIAGATTLVSRDCAGEGSGNNPSFAPVIAGDGLSVVFLSRASDLTSGEFGGGVHPQLFRRDLTTGRTELISRNFAQTGGANHDCFEPAISFQGAVIAFASHASDLALNDANDSEDVFAWNAGAAPAPIPPLAIHRQGDNEVVLSWPAPSTGYSLEAADNLNPASVWTPVNTLVSDNGLRKSVTLLLDTSRTARFFRLRK